MEQGGGDVFQAFLLALCSKSGEQAEDEEECWSS